MDINSKAAIVTGGATGVGRATALQLAKQGCHVLISYSKSQTEAEETAAEVEALGVKAIAMKADVADDDACRKAVNRAVDEFDRLDILVNNAGTTRFIPLENLEEVKLDDWENIFSVNVRGTFQMTRAAQAALIASGNAEVVNVSSIAALRGVGSSIPYCASKAAVNNMTISLARILAPKVRVNAIAPGFITGRWLEKGLGEQYQETLEKVQQATLLGKVSQPDDVARAIVSVITGSDLVTGQIIVHDAGMMIA